ncbi:CheR family methyltransferase [Microvirga puerhi]|uniref:Blue-light-activated histidine kinase n=1 Tax=Microvirga puerhi TaxID=2876078 RepID=A0ABS7VKC1_9HYPH|nr:CheR family methyltransferase [Microvirga puerhi]MBZ6075616.1 PAS domain-containing protein [Microvirga puerhi]
MNNRKINKANKANQAGKAKTAKAKGSSDSGKAPLIVAIGALSTSLESFERLIASLGGLIEMAVVIVLQQREALDEEKFLKALSQARGFTTAPIEHGAAVEGGRIYLAGPNIALTIKGGKFQSQPAQETPGRRATIDSFLLSLAEDQHERAIGIVFNGTGGDGTLGVAALKEYGGLSIAESDGNDWEHDLASSNTAAALADFLLPVERIPECIEAYAQHLASLQEAAPLDTVQPEVTAALTRVAAILRNATGHDFHGYKQNTFLRRVQRRMQVVQAPDIDAYADFLRNDPSEAQNLFNDLLIGVTQFFRDAKEFELLETEVIPKLFEGKGARDQVRVWVLGCATGEEAYSIAILLREHMAKLDIVPQVQIFATDIDGRALAAARVGRYPETVANDVSPERLARWFIKEGKTYSVVKELREMCIFSAHNVIKDAPFSRLDLISCRNLLIYLNSDLQSRVIPLLHFALRPNGFLFLGNSENVTRHPKLFTPIDRRARIFRRLETAGRVLPDFPITTASGHRPDTAIATGRPRMFATRLLRGAEHIAQSYAPAYVIIDEHLEVLHFSERTGRYLDPPGGAASLNLLNLINRDLRLDLRAALQKAADHDEVVKAEKLQMRTNDSRVFVDLVVEPVRDGSDTPRNYVVIFKDSVAAPDTVDAVVQHGGLSEEHVQQLEAELRSSRDRLQATIEELESTNEELKSSNEEYQSLNEELQSANEELETSKEELQSVNEELTTVNTELAQRVQELARRNSDLKNFFESTQIATIFLDNDFRVMSFTPAVTEIFHLVETDIGRPITHIKSRIIYEELHDDIRRVIRTLATVEREIENEMSGARYIVRILPYRSVDNFIGGVVVTFVDVTPLARVQEALRVSERRLSAILDQLPVGVGVFDREGDAELSNRVLANYALEHIPSRDTIDSSRWRGYRPDGSPLDRSEYPGGRALRGETVSPGVDFLFTTADGQERWTRVTSAPFRNAAQEITGAIVVVQDVDREKRAEEHQKLLLAELQHRVRNTLTILRSVARQTGKTSSTVEEYVANFDGRLNAFARVQTLATRDPTSGVDLEYLIAEELFAHATRESEQVTLAGPEIRLQPKAAETFGLVMHELTTNAVKYGALSSANGRVSVDWHIESDKQAHRLVFNWVESGVLLTRQTPSRRGFGTELIERTLSYDLDAQASLSFPPEGFRCTIMLPLTERIMKSPGPQSP